MDDKTYNRITTIILFIVGLAGLVISLFHAIPIYGPIGLIGVIISICIIILGLDKDT